MSIEFPKFSGTRAYLDLICLVSSAIIAASTIAGLLH